MRTGVGSFADAVLTRAPGSIGGWVPEQGDLELGMGWVFSATRTQLAERDRQGSQGLSSEGVGKGITQSLGRLDISGPDQNGCTEGTQQAVDSPFGSGVGQAQRC